MKTKGNNSNSSTGAYAKGTPVNPKKDVYVSINTSDELAALEKLGFRERWAYIRCKKIGNFKTGSVGEFKNQRLTYGDIAAMVTAPATQGRGQGSIDDTQAADFLKRMQEVGLVANIGRRANGGLRFDLPLSPIGRAKAQSGQISGKFASISPTAAVPETAEKPMPVRACDELDHYLSVMISRNTNIIIDEAGAADAEPASRRATGAALLGKTNSVTEPAPPARLSAQDIFDAIGASWTFTETDTPEAWKLYATWANAGITIEQLHVAMDSLEEGQARLAATPQNLATQLVPIEFDAWLDRQSE